MAREVVASQREAPSRDQEGGHSFQNMASRVLLFLLIPASLNLQPGSATFGPIIRGLQNALLPTPELIAKYGYPAETHEVTTQDGYVINFHRIPHGRSGPSKDRPVVFVQHGLMCSSAAWVLSGPEKSLGFILADAGYDVWLGSFRGNTYARKHISLRPSQLQFWKFSWHESGMYDLPAQIDYVLEKTGQKQLYYIGHSMGTTAFYVMASSRPEYNSKIRAQFSLAPVAFMSRLTSYLIRLMSTFEHTLNVLLKFIGRGEFLPNNLFLSKVTSVVCKDKFFKGVCRNLLFLTAGFNKQQFNNTLLPAIFRHTPAGASTNQLIHYSQGIKSAKFRQFNYGRLTNLLTYGSAQAPDYDLSKVTAPVFLHWSDNDWLAAVEDVKELAGKLANVSVSRRVPDPKFNHLDYMWAIDVKPLLYDTLLAQLRSN